jgi:phospholipid/cholesterol/gamma-HCH transport system ATP-binding protein
MSPGAVEGAPGARIEVTGLDVGYGGSPVMRDLNFRVMKGDIFIIMGGSGCGKSTVMKSLVGLLAPIRGRVLYEGVSFWETDAADRNRIMSRFGVLYQSGALWSSMTLLENVSLPLQQHTKLPGPRVRELASLKLALVGLAGFENFYPAEISGGMKKRAALARAIALEPETLFFDEPSAGLDPAGARMLDDLILELRHSLGATVVVVTHELASIFAIGTNSIFLDPEAGTMTASGPPRRLLEESRDPRLIEFLTRGEGTGRAAFGHEHRDKAAG